MLFYYAMVLTCKIILKDYQYLFFNKIYIKAKYIAK